MSSSIPPLILTLACCVLETLCRGCSELSLLKKSLTAKLCIAVFGAGAVLDVFHLIRLHTNNLALLCPSVSAEMATTTQRHWLAGAHRGEMLFAGVDKALLLQNERCVLLKRERQTSRIRQLNLTKARKCKEENENPVNISYCAPSQHEHER